MTNPKLVPFHMPVGLIPKMDKQTPAYWTAHLWLTKERPLDYWWIASPMAIPNRYDPQDPFASAQRPYIGERPWLPHHPSCLTKITARIQSTPIHSTSTVTASVERASSTPSMKMVFGSTRPALLLRRWMRGFRKNAPHKEI